MKKYNLKGLILIGLLISFYGYSQPNPRLLNRQYMKTVFFEDFNDTTLNRDIWGVQANWKRKLNENIWVDNTNTVSQSNGNLNLSMLYSPGYKVISDGKTYTANYIAGEVRSILGYQYGSFECRAKFAFANGFFSCILDKWG